MDILIESFNGVNVATPGSSEMRIKDVGAALDFMANCDYLGARHIVLEEKHFSQEFFDLRTRLAGEILQKFVQYGVRLAVVGDFEKYESKSLRDFIYESNRTGSIYFLSTKEEAVSKLTGSVR